MKSEFKGEFVMLFKDFRNTMEYLTADVIEFVDTDGNVLDIDDLEDEVLDNFYVKECHKGDSEVLEIVLN